MSAFEIIGDGVSLDVEDGARLTTEFVATTFNESAVFAGSFSYPLTFPLTAKNINFFGHAQHLENREARVDREVVIVLFGLSWKRATLSYEVKRGGYVGELLVDNGAVANWMREVKLQDVFTSRGKRDAKDSQVGDIVHQGIALGNTAAEVELRLLQENKAPSPFCFPLLINTKMFGEPDDVDKSLINDFDNLASVADDGLYSPQFYHLWVLRAVCQWMGYRAAGSYVDDVFMQELIIDNNGIRTGLDLKTNRTINPAEHLPGITVAEYIKALRNDHRVMIYFDSLSKTAYFELPGKIIGQPDRLDLCENIHYDSLHIKKQADQAFRLLTKKDDGDELYEATVYEKSVLVGYDLNKAKDFELAIGTPFMRRGPIKNLLNVLCPISMRMVNIYSEEYNVPETENVYNEDNVYVKNPFEFRLMAYKGFQRVAVDPDYDIPFATADERGNMGVLYEHSCKLGGVNGLLNRYALPYYRMYCLSEQVEFTTEISPIDFFKIAPLQKIMLTDRNRARVEALLDKIVFEPRESGRSIVGKVTCYPNYNMIGGAQNVALTVADPVLENTNGTIYAKLLIRPGRTVFDGSTPVEFYYDLNIDFFSDSSGALPREVKALPYQVEVKYYDVENTANGSFFVYTKSEFMDGEANGVTQYVGEVKDESFGGGFYVDEKCFLLSPRNRFKPIGSYQWINGQWSPVTER